MSAMSYTQRFAASAFTALAALAAGCAEGGDSEPWAGTLKEGVELMAKNAGDGEVEAALAVANRMLEPGAMASFRQRLDGWTRGASESVLGPLSTVLDAVGVSALQPEDRAEIEYARSATLLTGAAQGGEDAPGLMERAEAALDRARAAAPGGARASAIYNLGTLDLMAAEAVRATIPEISGQPPATAPGQAGRPASPPDPNAEEQPDPIDVARAGYLAAREHLVERLRVSDSDGGDADEARFHAAANVELCIRRLRELDEIERQREEQQQDQDQDQEGEDGEQDKDQEKKENEDQEDSDKKPEDGDQSDEQDPSEDEQDPEEPQDGDEDEQEPEEPEEEPGEEEGEDEPEEAEANEDEQPSPEDEKIEEKTMTAEEFQRLLERNSKHQERGEEIRRMRRIRGKIPAKRDW